MAELTTVNSFFPELGDKHLQRLAQLHALVREWNDRVNLISRKDIGNLEEHHLLHSLAIARVLKPAAGARFADIGTGGGFPGLPLAVLFPDCQFTLIDSIAKKGRVVEAMAEELELPNVRVITRRAENIRGRYDFVLGRAVTALPTFLGWAAPLLSKGNESSIANGVLYFKGTLYREELAGSKAQPETVWPLNKFFPRPYFEDKFLLHFPAPISGFGKPR
jgi:16S rRNA (guanine527-N7)-methyltransferase